MSSWSFVKNWSWLAFRCIAVWLNAVSHHYNKLITYSEVTYTVNHDYILIDIYQLCEFNCISIHTLVFSPTRFGAFFPSIIRDVQCFDSHSTHSQRSAKYSPLYTYESVVWFPCYKTLKTKKNLLVDSRIAYISLTTNNETCFRKCCLLSVRYLHVAHTVCLVSMCCCVKYCLYSHTRFRAITASSVSLLHGCLILLFTAIPIIQCRLQLVCLLRCFIEDCDGLHNEQKWSKRVWH
jgi:hypothetical protein